MSIDRLPARVRALPEPERARFGRLFEVDAQEGTCVVPASMRESVIATYGSVEAVERQRVVRVTNTVVWEGAQYNPLRLRRPMPRGAPPARARQGFDPFERPLETTAADVFGRIRGQHCITTSNIARWEAVHAVLIFEPFDPLDFDAGHLRDYFAASRAWAAAARAELAREGQPDAPYFIWLWNGGAMGGASVAHAHAQLALARGRAYATVERLRRAALDYTARHGHNYFDDLRAAHDDVGLGFHAAGLPGFVNLAGLRAWDTWVLGDAFDDALADAFAAALRALVDRAGMSAFTASVVMPPIDADGRRERPDDPAWHGFPFIARVVDRGRAEAASSDIGSLDLFGASVIGHDPYTAVAALNAAEEAAHG
ncbi:MAG: hypothetical protein K1X39_09645 [Thermoflexales bacterium]|nr:hypothetical protein [Thermoflexales bacterium]